MNIPLLLVCVRTCILLDRIINPGSRMYMSVLPEALNGVSRDDLVADIVRHVNDGRYRLRCVRCALVRGRVPWMILLSRL